MLVCFKFRLSILRVDAPVIVWEKLNKDLLHKSATPMPLTIAAVFARNHISNNIEDVLVSI